MNHRRNNIQSATGVARASWKVLVCPVGAIVRTTQNSTTINVDAGHSFVVGDKYLINPGTDDTFSGTDTVQSVTATTVVMGESISMTKGDVLVNLGPDTGTASPNYDTSPVVIYSDMDGDDVVSNSQLTTDSDGEYSYYYRGDGAVWELVRDSADALQEVVKGWAAVPGRINVADYAYCDGSTNDAARLQAALDVMEELGGGVVFVPEAVTCSIESQLVMESGVRLMGAGVNASTIEAHSSNFPVDTALIKFGTTASTFDTSVEHIEIDCNAVSGSIGIYGEHLEEGAGVNDVRITKVMSKGFQVVNNGSPVSQNYSIHELTVWFNSTAPVTAVGVDIDSTGTFRGIDGLTIDVTPTGNNLGVGSRGVLLNGNHGVLKSIHIEDVDIGIELGTTVATGATVLNGVRGAASGSGTSLVKVGNDASNVDIVMLGLRAGSANWTNIVEDLLNSNTIPTTTENQLHFYATNATQFWQGMTLGRNADEDVTISFDLSTSTETIIWDESENAFTFSEGIRTIVGKNMTASRFIAGQGTALVDGDFAISAGWGATGSVAVTAGGRDTRFSVTVTAAGGSYGANPTITLTFKDGAYTVAPIVVAAWSSDSTGTQADIETDSTSTTAIITYVGTPDANTFKFNVIVQG